MQVNLGGDRLGSGAKINVDLKTFNRSTHDQSYLWRSTMAPGTLVPFLVLPVLRGDSIDIELNYDGKTLPTIGPLFGSYKVQLDIFQCPIRLYQGKLHMNKLGIGMEMNTIKLPQLRMEAYSPPAGNIDPNFQINPSCIFSHLNIRGLGRSQNPNQLIQRDFNGTPYLSLFDIYKNYYANKSEGIGAILHNPRISSPPPDSTIAGATFYNTNGTPVSVFGSSPVSIDVALGDNGLDISFSGTIGIPDPNQIYVDVDGIQYTAPGLFQQQLWQDQSRVWNFQGWTGPTNAQVMNVEQQNVPNIPYNTEGVFINTFDLKEIDKMREAILMDVQNPNAFIIDKNSPIPYSLPFKEGNVTGEYSKQTPQEGLLLKTYQSDLFNNWVKTDWIDGPNGIGELTKVDTSSGSFRIDQLNIAQKVYNMLNRIATAGGSYNDWLNTVYEENNSGLVESPIYLGGLSKEIAFQEVISNANAQFGLEAEQPLGTLAGRGIVTNKHKGGLIKARITEPSYLIGLCSITPRISYSSGNEWDTTLKTIDDFHKPSLSAIGFQDLITDQMHWADTIIEANTTLVFKSAGKVPAWINYMTATDKIRGNFAILNDSGFMVLDRRYEATQEGGIKDLTTYIDPSKHNQIFANTKLDAQNFWSQISVDITNRRIMSAKLIPNL